MSEKEDQTSRSLAIRFEAALLGVWRAVTQKAVVGDAQWLIKADMPSVDSTVSSRAEHLLNLKIRANLA